VSKRVDRALARLLDGLAYAVLGVAANADDGEHVVDVSALTMRVVHVEGEFYALVLGRTEGDNLIDLLTVTGTLEELRAKANEGLGLPIW
jgi:hypothetical protein